MIPLRKYKLKYIRSIRRRDDIDTVETSIENKKSKLYRLIISPDSNFWKDYYLKFSLERLKRREKLRRRCP